ncbi:MAG: peptidoglycan DD-metalloendopeptidase family protein [Paracoccaceae bacterium]
MSVGYFRRTGLILTSGCFLAACDPSQLDLDLRNNEYNTSSAAQEITAKRPQPDSKGIITYPNYQVAIARFGDTMTTLAERIGFDPTALARFNGFRSGDPLRAGEVIALPTPVAGTDPSTSADSSEIDVAELAQSALNQADQGITPATKPRAKPLAEPIRHKVRRGETAFTISRLYNVSVRSLADWNALDSNFTIREGQYLLVPATINNVGASPDPVSEPGEGSATPLPPSAVEPMPETVEEPAETSAPAVTEPTQTASGGRLAYPVKGKIIREYVKGKTDGIDLSAPVGSTVVAAESGTVAAITADADQVPILVLKHADNLLTVYANIGDISVEKGQAVSRGRGIGKIRKGNPSYLHFEVRKGFESVDPMDYLN